MAALLLARAGNRLVADSAVWSVYERDHFVSTRRFQSFSRVVTQFSTYERERIHPLHPSGVEYL